MQILIIAFFSRKFAISKILYNFAKSKKKFYKKFFYKHRNILYLVQLYIVERKENLIFHINYMNCKPLADALKSTFNCKTVLAVHYLDSIIALMGNISRLRRIISQSEDPTNEREIFVK